jgi:transposase-like protein
MESSVKEQWMYLYRAVDSEGVPDAKTFTRSTKQLVSLEFRDEEANPNSLWMNSF